MDEIRFVNEYVRDKKAGEEIYGHRYFKSPNSILGYSIIAFYIATMLYYASVVHRIEFWMIVVLIAYLSIRPIQYFIYLNRFKKREEMLLHGKPSEVYVDLTDEKVFISRTETDQYLLISDLKRVFETKNYIVPVAKQNMLIILHKDGFTTGDLDGFRAFLKDKGIKVKGKKK